jgi:hypothetical protein
LVCAFDTPAAGQTASILAVVCCTAVAYTELAIDLGPRRPRSMVLGKVDDDDHLDVVLGYQGLARFDVFVNQTAHRPGTPMFQEDALGGWALDLAAVAPLAGAQPALADFDFDGDGDLAYACASGGVVVIGNELTFATPRPVITPLPDVNVTDYIDIHIESEPPATASHIEVRLWRLEHVSSSGGYVVIGREELNEPIRVPVASSSSVEVPLDEPDLENGGFFGTAQYVAVDGASVTPCTPAALFRIVVDSSANEPLLTALGQLPVGTPTVVRQIDGGHNTSVTPIPIPPPPPPPGTTPPAPPM